MMDVRAEAERLRGEIEAAHAMDHAKRYGTDPEPCHLRERRDFLALDIGTSGAFLVRKADGAVFGIKGYGVPDYRKGIGFAGPMTGAEILAYRWRRGPFRLDMREVRHA